jgi:hypothetical protein
MTVVIATLTIRRYSVRAPGQTMSSVDLLVHIGLYNSVVPPL